MSESLELERPPPEVGAEVRPVGRGVIETLSVRGAVLPLSFAIGVVTSRSLLPVGRGAFVLGLLVVTLAAALLGNVGTALVHEVGKDPSAARALYGRAIALTTLLGLLGAAALVPFDLAVAQQDYRVVTLAVFGLPPLLISQTVGPMLLALNRLRLWNLLQIVLPAVTLAGMLIFVVGLSKGVTGAVTAWVIGQGAAAGVGLYATRGLWWPPRFDLSKARPLLLLGLRIGAVNLLSLINYRIELIVLERYRGLNDVGIYSLATSLAELLWLVSSAVSTAIVAPAIHGDEKRAVDVVAKGIRHVLLATAILGIALAALSPWLVPTVFGPRFGSSVAPLVLLLPGVVAFAPATVLAVFFSMRIGRARYAFTLALASTITTGTLSLLLIPAHGVRGAALASTIGYAVSMVLSLGWFVRLTHVPVRRLVPWLGELAAYGKVARVIVRRA